MSAQKEKRNYTTFSSVVLTSFKERIIDVRQELILIKYPEVPVTPVTTLGLENFGLRLIMVNRRLIPLTHITKLSFYRKSSQLFLITEQ